MKPKKENQENHTQKKWCEKYYAWGKTATPAFTLWLHESQRKPRKGNKQSEVIIYKWTRCATTSENLLRQGAEQEEKQRRESEQRKAWERAKYGEPQHPTKNESHENHSDGALDSARRKGGGNKHKTDHFHTNCCALLTNCEEHCVASKTIWKTKVNVCRSSKSKIMQESNYVTI